MMSEEQEGYLDEAVKDNKYYKRKYEDAVINFQKLLISYTDLKKEFDKIIHVYEKYFPSKDDDINCCVENSFNKFQNISERIEEAVVFCSNKFYAKKSVTIDKDIQTQMPFLNLESEFQTINENLSRIKEDKVGIQRDLEDFKKAFNDNLNLQKNEIKEKMKEIEKKYKLDFNEVAEERERYNKHIKEIKILREKNKVLDKENKLLQQKAEYLNDSWKDISSNHKDLEHKFKLLLEEKQCRIKNLESQLKELITYRESSKIKNKQYITKLRTFKKQIETLRKENAEAKQEIQRLENLVSKEREINSEMAANVSELEKKYHGTINEIVDLKERILNKELHIDQLTGEVTSAKNIIASKEKNIIQIKIKFKEKISKLKEENERKAGLISKLSSKLKASKLTDENIVDQKKNEDLMNLNLREQQILQAQNENLGLKNIMKEIALELQDI